MRSAMFSRTFSRRSYGAVRVAGCSISAMMCGSISTNFPRLRRAQHHSSPGETAPVTGPSEVRTGKAPDKDNSPLSEIIKAVHSRYNTEFTEEHRVYLEVERQRLAFDPQLRQRALVNTEEQFVHAFNHKADLNLIRGIETHNSLVNALMKDQKAWHALRREMMRIVHDDIHKNNLST